MIKMCPTHFSHIKTQHGSYYYYGILNVRFIISIFLIHALKSWTLENNVNVLFLTTWMWKVSVLDNLLTVIKNVLFKTFIKNPRQRSSIFAKAKSDQIKYWCQVKFEVWARLQCSWNVWGLHLMDAFVLEANT